MTGTSLPGAPGASPRVAASSSWSVEVPTDFPSELSLAPRPPAAGRSWQTAGGVLDKLAGDHVVARLQLALQHTGDRGVGEIRDARAHADRSRFGGARIQHPHEHRG